MMKTMHTYVHCHLCPLKDHCVFSAKDESWTWQRYLRLESKGYSEKLPDVDLSKLDMATLNCPLLKVVEIKRSIEVINEWRKEILERG